MIKLVGENLKQYELNRRVEIIPFADGVPMTITVENQSVHPFHVPIIEEDGAYFAEIPNLCLLRFGIITVKALIVYDDGEQRRDIANFVVARREKPEDYVFVENEILTLDDVKKNDNDGGSSDEDWIGDGNTHIWITLHEGRTSPMLGCCPNGTVTVDWGDGTEPDTLTGTSVTSVKWTPTHNYAEPGDYVITLTVDGTMGFYGSSYNDEGSGILRYARGADKRNYTYRNAVQKVEIGEDVTSIGNNAFSSCSSLASVIIPGSVTSIGEQAFSSCSSLASIIIPDGVTSIGDYAFYNCHSLASVIIPDSVTSIGNNAFYNCHSLASITIPGSVTSIGEQAFSSCSSLASIIIPDGVTSIGNYAFNSCSSLASIIIPDGVTSIGDYAFGSCSSLASIIIPDGVTSINFRTFYSCYGVRFYDFTRCTEVPTLSDTSAFSSIPTDCQMLIPAALYDEWSTATNWTTYASYMVAV